MYSTEAPINACGYQPSAGGAHRVATMTALHPTQMAATTEKNIQLMARSVQETRRYAYPSALDPGRCRSLMLDEDSLITNPHPALRRARYRSSALANAIRSFWPSGGGPPLCTPLARMVSMKSRMFSFCRMVSVV